LPSTEASDRSVPPILAVCCSSCWPALVLLLHPQERNQKCASITNVRRLESWRSRNGSGPSSRRSAADSRARTDRGFVLLRPHFESVPIHGDGNQRRTGDHGLRQLSSDRPLARRRVVFVSFSFFQAGFGLRIVRAPASSAAATTMLRIFGDRFEEFFGMVVASKHNPLLPAVGQDHVRPNRVRSHKQKMKNGNVSTNSCPCNDFEPPPPPPPPASLCSTRCDIRTLATRARQSKTPSYGNGRTKAMRGLREITTTATRRRTADRRTGAVPTRSSRPSTDTRPAIPAGVGRRKWRRH
jgi:hypothetical protein